MKYGRRVEALHQQPAFIIERRIAGPANLPNSAFGKPGSDGGEQPFGDGRIVDRFEETEEASLLGMKPIVGMIENGHDSAARLAVAIGQEGLGFGVGVERMPGEADEALLVHEQRRNPIRIARVMVERKLEKLLPLPAAGDRFDRNIRQHAQSALMFRRPKCERSAMQRQYHSWEQGRGARGWGRGDEERGTKNRRGDLLARPLTRHRHYHPSLASPRFDTLRF